MTRRAGGEIVLTSDSSAAQRDMSRFQNGLMDMGATATKVGGILTKTLTVGVVAVKGAMVASLRGAMDYESQMARVAGISGAVGDELDDLDGIVREMGRSTSFSSLQAAKGLEYLAMAGWEVHQMVEGLPAILRMAEATQMDLAVASDIVSDMMTAFRLEATQAGQVTDVLAKAATTANTSVEMLGETMKYVGPVAATAGWSIEETAAMAGKLADAGIKGSQAGTYLRSTIMDLTDASDDGQATLDRLGVSIYDAEGEMRSAVDIIRDLEQGMEGMSSQQRSAALSAIFNTRSLTAMNVLLGEGADSIEAYTNVLYDAEGAVEDMGEHTRDTAQYDVALLTSALDAVKLKLGDELIPLFREHLVPIGFAVIEILSGMVDWFTALEPSMQQAAIVGTLLAGALGPMLLLFGRLAPVIAGLLKGGLIPLIAAKVLLLAKFALIAAAIKGAIALVKHLWENNETLREVVMEVVDKVLEVWGNLKEHIGVLLLVFQQVFQGDMETALRYFGAFLGRVLGPEARQTFLAFIETVRGHLDRARAVIERITGAIAAWWDVWGEEILDVASRVWNQVWAIISKIIELVQVVIGNRLAFIQEMWDKWGEHIMVMWAYIWESIQAAAVAAFEIIASIIGGALEIISGILDVFIGAFTGDWERVWKGLASIVRGAGNMIIGVINAIIGAAERMMHALADALGDMPSFEIPSWVPVIGGNSFSLPGIPKVNLPRIPQIPTMDTGGWINGPAVVGVGKGVTEAFIKRPGGGKRNYMPGDIDYDKLARALARAIPPSLVQNNTVEVERDEVVTEHLRKWERRAALEWQVMRQ